MKNTLVLCTAFLITNITFAQDKYAQELKPFIGKEEFVSTNGPGMENKNADILLIVENKDEESITMKILRWKSDGKLKLIAENGGLVQSRSILGNSGSSYGNLFKETISVSTNIGSNSSYGGSEIKFEKAKDENYYFSTFTAFNKNYSRENYFSHISITSKQAPPIKFQDASENDFWNLIASKKEKPKSYEELNEEEGRYKKRLPKDFPAFSHFSVGDLNGDQYANDLILMTEDIDIFLLLEQKDGSYKKVAQNNKLIYLPDDFNEYNAKFIIKNGYFTIEQRMGNHQGAFNHYYTTFKYDNTKKNWFLHRIGIECYQDYQPKPIPPVIQKTIKDFGTLPFEKTTIEDIIIYNPKNFKLVTKEQSEE